MVVKLWPLLNCSEGEDGIVSDICYLTGELLKIEGRRLMTIVN